MEYELLKDLVELFKLCCEISATTKHDVFFDYSPHVNGFAVYVYTNGWDHYRTGEYLTAPGHDKITHENIAKCKNKLLDYRRTSNEA